MTVVLAVLSSSRRRQVTAWGLGAAAIATVLSACQKPTPQVTFQSGARSVLVSPSQYCFPNTSTCRTTSGRVSTALVANTGATINVSVPQDVAQNAWLVTAYSVAANGSNTPLEGAGSNVIVGQQDARVFVPLTTGSYLLNVAEVRDKRQAGTWTVQIIATN